MKRIVLTAVALFLLNYATSVAADGDPTGTWKWKYDNQSAYNTIKLKWDGEKLSGFVIRRVQGEVPIEDATFNDGVLSFKATIISELGDNTKSDVIFTGRMMKDDDITGTVETKRADGRGTKNRWMARRKEALIKQIEQDR